MSNIENSFFSDQVANHRHATIICTIGPACESYEMLKKLIEAGMDVARLNFSHGNHKQKKRIIKLIRRAEKETGKPVAILQDLQGPKLRVGEFRGAKSVKLEDGKKVTITTDPCFGTPEKFSVNYPKLPEEVRKGDPILLADGTIILKVLSATTYEVNCKIIHGGTLSAHKGVNLPGVRLSIPALTEKDEKDLEFGVKEGVNWIALSFVRKAKDIIDLRKRIMKIYNSLPFNKKSFPPKIIAKIEKPEGVENFSEITKEADGIMVARGDLGVEINPWKVPVIQKEIIGFANKLNKPVITATQMLVSMVNSPIATRAETSDVANAIFDGADAVMLSEETAMGKFPIEVVKYMDKIAKETEASPLFKPVKYAPSGDVADAVASSATDIAKNIDASCIVVFTHTGSAAIQVAQFRPKMPILALCTNKNVARLLKLYWNITAVSAPICKTRRRLFKIARENVLQSGFGKTGDNYVIIAGESSDPGKTNWVQAKEIK